MKAWFVCITCTGKAIYVIGLTIYCDRADLIYNVEGHLTPILSIHENILLHRAP